MFPLAEFADVLTSPFVEPLVDETIGSITVRDTASGIPVTARHHTGFHWELNSVSHRGTFCTVTQARPKGQKGPFLYAVKRLKPEWQRSPIGLAVLHREAELGRLISHPHLVPTLDANTEDDEPFLVQPWLQGKTLRDFVSQGRTARPAEAIWIIRQIAEALAALESNGFCHSDIKPGNIIVSPNGHATLIDLGLGRQMGEPSLPIDRAVCGTPKYMAPELANVSQCIDIRTDIYSLGLVMLEMLFEKTSYFSLPTNQTERQQSLSANLELLLRSMTDKDASKRPPTAGILVRHLISLELSLI